MKSWKPILTGALALIVLEVFVSTSAASNTSSLFQLPGQWAKKLIDPTLPLIGSAATSSTSKVTPSPNPVNPNLNHLTSSMGGP